jgi:hypothetical protein
MKREKKEIVLGNEMIKGNDFSFVRAKHFALINKT